MKELSIEEKARAYDEALERAKAWCDCEQSTTDDKILLKRIFPELKESEDERIKEDIISLVNKWWKEDGYVAPRFSSQHEMLDWLEKQGEHNNFIDKIQVGDKVTRNEDGVLVNLSQLNRVAKKQGEQKPAWSEEDEKLFKLSLENLTELKDRFGKEYGKVGDCIVWLKSLRPQPQWKPNDGQIEAIKDAIEFLGCTKKVREDLKSLYEQLKKLREEKL